MRRALVIVCKAPRPGYVKTRLVPPLSAEEAAELSRAFLLDTVSLGLALAWEAVRVVHPAADGPMLRATLPTQVTCEPQHGEGLGAALRGAFEQCFAHGFDRVVLIDSDSPTLPLRILREACARLEEQHVTIGPTADGGYYLLGLRQTCPGLFEGIAWSTASVYQQTCRRARELALSVSALEEWYDVDVPADLARLEADLIGQSLDVAVHTREILQRVTLPATG